MYVKKQTTLIHKALSGIILFGMFFNMFSGAGLKPASAQQEKTNLTPHTPSGWSNPIVASSETGTTLNSALYDIQYTYIDWAIINRGSSSAPFTTCIYYDGISLQCWDNDGLKFDEVTKQNDWILTIPTLPGVHHIEIVADVYHVVDETNEDDNAWGFDFEWVADDVTALAVGSPLIDDMLIAPDVELNAQSSTGSSAPGYYNTSDYMMGSVAVGIIFPESNGSGENWTQARKDQIVSEIQTGLNWWVQQASANGVSLSFVYDIRTVATTYEPVTLSSANDGTWISQVLTNMGYSGSDKAAQTRNYLNALRTSRGTKWAYTFFIVDSLNDTDGKFSNGYFGYAYLGGPYVVMTSDNDGWGVTNMDKVAAHETGHIFRAGDQYYQAGYGGCQSTTDPYGYLGIPNSNCAYNNTGAQTDVIMNANAWNLHWTTAQQIGWRDLDGDGRKDPLDTTPGINMSAYSPDPTFNTQLTYTGYAYENPYTRHSCCAYNDSTINTISSVQYRVDGGAWTNTSPIDGSFNTDYEQFTFTTPVLSTATHTIEVKVQNSIGAANPTYWSDTVTVQGSSLPGAFNKSAPGNTAVGQSTSATISWGASSAAISYQYCYDAVNDNNCSNWTSNGTSTSKALSGLTAGVTYYWHVRAINNGGTTYANANAAAFWSFTTQALALPGAFNKSLPGNSAVGQSSSATISWGASSGAASYQYCYDTSNDNTCSNWTSNGISTSKALSGLAAGTTYYWHVRAINNGGTTYSNGNVFWSFTTQSIGATVTVSANPNSLGMDSGIYANIEYAFTETTGGSGTIISRTSQFYTQDNVPLGSSIGPYGNSIPITANATTDWTDTIYLPFEIVEAARAAGKYTIVLKTTFSGIAISAPVSVLIYLPPAPFAKTSPLFNASVRGNSVTLSWNSTIGATHYEVCYDTSANGSCTPWLGTYSASKTINGLTPGTTYHWQVRAINSTGITYADYGSYWTFTTAANTDIYEVDNTSTQAKWIYAGAPQTHSIAPAEDVDWVKFQLPANSGITIETSGPAAYADTYVYLYSSTNLTTPIEEDDDTGYNIYSYINRVCNSDALPAGTYYIKTKDYSNSSEIASYNLTFNIQPCTPNAPSGLMVSGVTTSSISLAWTDNSFDETGFNIYRWGYEEASSQWKFIYHDYVVANQTTYTQNSLDCGNDFNFYEVSAYNLSGESQHIGWVQGITNPCPPVALSITNLTYYPFDPFTNDNAYVEVEVENLSDTAAPFFWIDVYVDDTPTGCMDWGNYFLGVEGLAAHTTQTWVIKIPASSQISGAHQLRAFVDSGCDVVEDDDDNNMAGPTAITYQEPPPPPAHDDISNALFITPFPYTHNVNVSGATNSTEDPGVPVTACNLAPGLASVWYRYTPSYNTSLNLDTFGSDYDTYIAVWTGAPSSLTLVGCNDDSSGGQQSLLNINVSVGTAYYVEVAEYNGMNNTASPLFNVELPPGAQNNSRPNLDAGMPVLNPEKPVTSTTDINALAGGSLSFHVSFVTRAITGNAGVGGATLSYTDETAKTVIADSSGNYTLNVPIGWVGTITPSKFAYAFTPVSKTYTAVLVNKAAQNYTAVSLMPGAFVKSSPANAAINQPLSVTLSWTGSNLATSYEYCYDTSTGCNVWENANANTSVTITGLNISTTYYWQVRAKNIYGTTAANGTTYWTFRTGEAPAAFTKSSPAHTAGGQLLNPSIKWNASSGVTPPLYYEYCYSLTNNTCTRWVNNGLTRSADLRGLSPATPYFWQVRAVNAFGTTYANNSTWFSFTTDSLEPAVTLYSVKSNDGWTLESSEFSGAASTKSNSGFLRVGDDARNRQYRSLLYFDTASIPNNAAISSVVVKITKDSATGDVLPLGDLTADIKNGFFGLNLLELSDFNAAAAPINTVGRFTTSDYTLYQLTLNPLYFKYINLTGVTQFRLRFTKDDNNDRGADFLSFYEGESANQPQLIIVYTLP